MSDNDYSDIDIDVEESGHSQSSVQNSSDINLHDSKRHARAQHNALERRRRDNIKDMYTSLKDEIPNFNSERASRAQILKKAIEQIQERRTNVEQLNQEVEQIEEANEKLRQELLSLQEELRNGSDEVNQNEVVINGSQSQS